MNSKIRPIKEKGHSARWYNSWNPIGRRMNKKLSCRAQRRYDHKEIEEQWLADWEHSMKYQKPANVEATKAVTDHIWAVIQLYEPGPNMFSPVPHWLMSEDEKSGMEYWRQMKSISALTKKRGGSLAWREQLRRQNFLMDFDTDETLFEDLQRSLKR